MIFRFWPPRESRCRTWRCLRGSCFFRPLSTYWLTLANVSLWGFEPFGHHATHLAIFLATVGLLYRWLLEATGRTTAALVGAGLYAFSKTHLYTLAWIAGGIDVSGRAVFCALSLGDGSLLEAVRRPRQEEPSAAEQRLE